MGSTCVLPRSQMLLLGGEQIAQGPIDMIYMIYVYGYM